jgi:hypothetical protein
MSEHSGHRNDDHTAHEDEPAGASATTYARFGAMILVSMVVMYGVMYLNTYEWGHVEWSETRFFMTWLMGATMAVVMLSFMWSMHPSRAANIGICVGAAVVFGVALWLVRSQTTVDDRSYMRAMIPHHSIAVLTSINAQIEDVRVRQLADEIIEAQCREIAEMDWLIDDISERGPVTDADEVAERAAPEFDGRC